MKSLRTFVIEAKASKKINIDAWHATKKPFEPPFKESKIGSQNDEGFSGRGFYFFGQEKDTKLAVRDGYKRQFHIELKKAYDLDKDDIFSKDIDKPYSQYRDEETLRLLEEGYDGTFRTLNGRLDEVCVFSFKDKGYDGNRKIKPKGDWIKI